MEIGGSSLHRWQLRNAAILFAGCIGLALIAAVEWNAYVNHDAAWFTWGAERMLQGAVLGRDFVEPNFPLAYLVYVPAAILGKIFGLSAGLKLWILILATVSVAMALPRIASQAQLPFLILFFLFQAFAMPREFAQREQIAFLLVLPYCLPHSQHGWRGVLVGVMAGIGFAIKPHFLIAWMVVEIGRRPFRTEQLALVATGVAYMASILLFFRTFAFEMLPVTRAVYAAFDRPGATGAVALATMLFVILFLASRVLADRTAQLVSQAAGGFIIAAFAQQRLYPYQLLPAWELLWLGSALLISHRRILPKVTAIVILTGIMLELGPASAKWMRDVDQKRITIPRLTAILDAHRDFVVLAVHPYPAFPSVIYTRARYLGLSNSHWFLPAVAQSNGANQTARRYAVWQATVELSRTPQIVIVDRDWRRHTATPRNWNGLQWLISQPSISRFWQAYRRCTSVGQFDVYVRKNEVSYKGNSSATVLRGTDNPC